MSPEWIAVWLQGLALLVGVAGFLLKVRTRRKLAARVRAEAAAREREPIRRRVSKNVPTNIYGWSAKDLALGALGLVALAIVAGNTRKRLVARVRFGAMQTDAAPKTSTWHEIEVKLDHSGTA